MSAHLQHTTMANSRRVPNPGQQYYPAHQSSQSSGVRRQPSQPNPYRYATAYQPSHSSHMQNNHSRAGYGQGYSNSQMNYRQQEAAQGVATGAIGGGYGPYSYNPVDARPTTYSSSRFTHPPSNGIPAISGEKAALAATKVTNSNSVPAYMWDAKDPDLNDALHNPDPVQDRALDRSFTIFSPRGWSNVSALALLIGGLLVLFIGYPILIWARENNRVIGFNLGGINGTGQFPDIPNMPSLIDKDTDKQFYTRTGTDGQKYNLVFSDEFETEGRTFWPGDDPFWEAVDLNYWPTGDIEWYDPQAITTENGKLVITMEEINNHDLNFQSGMIQSWNKLCFTTGYIEVSVSMPGRPQAPGLWPAVWTMGNLGRAGYGATTEGMWPYSYDTCDVGTFINQTDHNGNPVVAATGGKDGAQLSFLPGQRLSACTCPGSDHPGPSVNTGRGVPEIDIFETQIDTSRFQAEVSQSLQIAPYNLHYVVDNSTDATTIYDSSITKFNTYTGGPYQQAVSAVTDINNADYDDQGYATYGYEWWSDPNNRDSGYVTWFSQGSPTWKVTSQTIGPDSATEVSQRLIAEEPVSIIMNLGMSPTFQQQDFKHLTFPVKMYIDYVRVYQRAGVKDGIGCSPPSHPTADYIQNHLNAYSNPNLTTWHQAGYNFPRNSKYDGC